MTRKSLTGKEADLLINTRDACARALRVGLSESEDRSQLNLLAKRILHMLASMGQEP